MLRKDTDAEFRAREIDSATGSVSGHYFTTGGRDAIITELTEREFNAVNDLQTHTPFVIAKSGRKSWWVYQDTYWWEDEGYDSPTMKAAILERQEQDQRRQASLRQKHGTDVAVAAVAPVEPITSFEFRCGCGQKLTAPSTHKGRDVTCPTCGHDTSAIPGFEPPPPARPNDKAPYNPARFAPAIAAFLPPDPDPTAVVDTLPPEVFEDVSPTQPAIPVARIPKPEPKPIAAISGAVLVVLGIGLLILCFTSETDRYGQSKHAWAALLGAIFLLVSIICFARAFATPCPTCGAKFSARWLNQRVDGGPDRRYRDNWRICGKCFNRIGH